MPLCRLSLFSSNFAYFIPRGLNPAHSYPARRKISTRIIDPSPSLLHPFTDRFTHQLQWLKDSLTESTALWKIIVTSVPLSIPTGASDDERDGWANFEGTTGYEIEVCNPSKSESSTPEYTSRDVVPFPPYIASWCPRRKRQLLNYMIQYVKLNPSILHCDSTSVVFITHCFYQLCSAPATGL